MARTNPYGLPDKQWRFVQEYLLDHNATAAYQRAGYKARGDSARASAPRLLANVSVARAIEAEQAKRSQRTHITADAVLNEIALLQHSDITHYAIDDYGNMLLREDAPPGAMRAVASFRKRITHHIDGSLTYDAEFRLWNKPASVRMGGQHLGLFKEQVEVSGTLKVVRLPQKAVSAEAWHQTRNGNSAHAS